MMKPRYYKEQPKQMQFTKGYLFRTKYTHRRTFTPIFNKKYSAVNNIDECTNNQRYAVELCGSSSDIQQPSKPSTLPTETNPGTGHSETRGTELNSSTRCSGQITIAPNRKGTGKCL